MSGAKRYRKKPVEIEAMLWDGTADGAGPIVDWVLDNGGTARWHEERLVDTAQIPSGAVISRPRRNPVPTHIAIDTLEGTMRTAPGDWVIRGVQGEFYPCKPDIFAATYDVVTS